MKILLTGGLGDLFAIEAGWSDDFRSQIREMYWATSRSKQFRELFDLLPNFQITRHVELWDDWSSLPTFFSRKHLQDHIACSIDDVDDWSISQAFPKLSIAPQSSFLRHRIARVDRDLPDDFVVVVDSTPYNRPEHRQNRDFTREDWTGLIARLEEEHIHGVILNSGDKRAPDHSLLIDLTGETTLAESVEILKRASGYYGIDSALSVLAAKLFTADRLWIRARNQHVYKYLDRYYRPHDDFPFVVWSFAPIRDHHEPFQDYDDCPPVPKIRLWITDAENGRGWRATDGDPVPGDLSRGDKPNLVPGQSAEYRWTRSELDPDSLDILPDDVREVWTWQGMISYAQERGYEIADITDEKVVFHSPKPDETESISETDLKISKWVLNVHSRGIAGRILLQEPSPALRNLLSGLGRGDDDAIAFAGPSVVFDADLVAEGGVVWSGVELDLRIFKKLPDGYYFRKFGTK